MTDIAMLVGGFERGRVTKKRSTKKKQEEETANGYSPNSSLLCHRRSLSIRLLLIYYAFIRNDPCRALTVAAITMVSEGVC
jgi:hypothetical protein